MSEESYNLYGTPPLQSLCNFSVKSASGGNLQPMGKIECTFTLGEREYTQPFIVCRKLTRSIILGRDFLRGHRLHVGWSKQRRFQVKSGKQVLVEAITAEENPVVMLKRNITVPSKTLVVVEMQTTVPNLESATFYDFSPTERYLKQGLNLVLIPIAYHTSTSRKQILLQVLINFDEEEIKLTEGTVMGCLIDAKEIA